jgi:Zn-dependent membrane protease YugP
MVGKQILYARSPVIDALVYLGGAILLCLLFSGIIYFSYQNSYAGFKWDDAYYLLMADLFSPYLNEVPTTVAIIAGQRNYPPIYPLFIALFGGGSASIGTAHLATSTALVVGFVAFYIWLVKQPLNPIAALLLTIVAVLSPMTLLHFQTLWSEHLYLALSISALLCLQLTGRDSKYWLLAGALVALASLTRTVGVTLIAAFVLHAVIRNPPRRNLLILTVSLPFIAERFLNTLLSISGHSYEGHLLSLSLPGIWTALSQSPASFHAAWTEAFSFQPGLPITILAYTVLAFSVMELVHRLREKRIDAFYLFLYLIVVVLWPFSNHAFRFIYPVFFILLGYSVLLLQRYLTSARLQQPDISSFIGAVLFVVVCIPVTQQAASRLSEPAPSHLRDYRHTVIWISNRDPANAVDTAAARYRLIEDMQVLKGKTDGNSCIYTEFPPLVRLFSNRRALPPPWDNPAQREGFNNLICPYYYMIPLMSSGYDPQSELPAEFIGNSEVLHISDSPRDKKGVEKLGILLRL